MQPAQEQLEPHEQAEAEPLQEQPVYILKVGCERKLWLVCVRCVGTAGVQDARCFFAVVCGAGSSVVQLVPYAWAIKDDTLSTKAMLAPPPKQ